MDEPAKVVIIGFIEKLPIKHNSSPTQLAVRGVPQLARVKIKKKMAKIGIFVTSPL